MKGEPSGYVGTLLSPPRLVVDGSEFVPGDRIEGIASFDRTSGPITATVALRPFDVVFGTKVYRHPLAVVSLSLPRAGEQRFVLTVPDNILPPVGVPSEGPVEITGWDVTLSVDLITYASKQVTLS